MKNNYSLFSQLSIIYVLSLSIFLFSSCLSQEEVPILPAFDPYVQKFEEEAAKRGENIDIGSMDISFTFVNSLPAGVAGQCDRRSSPREVRILSSFWYSASEQDKERLFFHELGHCVLDRNHENKLTSNKEYYSIMQGSGGTLDFGHEFRNRFVNFTGFRREFYLDELFDPEAQTPFWHDFSANYDDILPADKETIFFDEFEDNQNNWPVGSNGIYSSTIENGEYTYTTQDVSQYPRQLINIDLNRDFEIELKIKDDNKGTVLAFGGNQPNNLYYFHYTTYYGRNNGGFLEDGYNYGYISRTFTNERVGTVYVWQAIQGLETGDYITLTVRRQGDFLYYFINKEFFYVNDFGGFEGNLIGFAPAGGSSLSTPTTTVVDYLRVNYID